MVTDQDVRTLVVAVHPDDETLGAGGTLLRRKAEGGTIHWLILTRAHTGDFTAEQVETQAAQVANVETAYGFDSTTWADFPTTKLETLPLNSLVECIRAAVQTVRPTEVILPNRSDVHSDHRVAFQASMAVTKSFYMASFGIQRVMMMETISETDAAPPFAELAFLPNVFVDISNQLARKLELMSLYRTEVHEPPGPRSLSSIEALARYRGATINRAAAETFMLIRQVQF